jgi:subtilisin family serine protease
MTGRWALGWFLLLSTACAPLPTAPAAAGDLPVGSGFLVGSAADLPLPSGWAQQRVSRQVVAVQAPPGADNVAGRLRALPGVSFVDANRPLGLPKVQATGTLQTTAAGDAETGAPAWNLSLAGFVGLTLPVQPEPVTVAVIDSGIDISHPDLSGRCLPVVDVWRELHGADRFSFGARSYLTDGKDGNGHGTHVAGILAAASAVAGDRVQLLPIKATSASGATDALTLSRSIRRAIDSGCRVINLSIGGPADNGDPDIAALKAMTAEALAQGVTIVAASGNESHRSQRQVATLSLPADYPGVIAVGAVTQYNKVAEYSNGGPALDVSAPGGGALGFEGKAIRSTLPTYPSLLKLESGISGNYGAIQGTSMAVPHVSALAALILTEEPQLTPQQVCRRIALTCDDIGIKGWDPDTGFGRINAPRALHERVE